MNRNYAFTEFGSFRINMINRDLMFPIQAITFAKDKSTPIVYIDGYNDRRNFTGSDAIVTGTVLFKQNAIMDYILEDNEYIIEFTGTKEDGSTIYNKLIGVGIIGNSTHKYCKVFIAKDYI